MARVRRIRVSCAAALLLAWLGAGCTEDATEDATAPDGFSEVTPKSLPAGVQVEVLEPLKLTDKARLPENDPAFERVEVFKDRLVYHFTEKPTLDLAPGHVVAGGKEIGYLRKIASIQVVDDKTLEVATTTATLGELILSGHFRVTQEALASTWISDGGDIASRRYPLGAEHNYSIFGEKELTDGLECKGGGGLAISLDPTFDLTPRMIFDVDYDPGVALIDGELVYAKLAFEGSLSAGFEAAIKGKAELSCELDFIEAARALANNDNLFRLWLPTLNFAIGPVPVVITHYLEPLAKMSAGGAVELALLSANAKVDLGVTMGTEYSGGQWRTIWEPKSGGDLGFTFDPPTDVSALKLSAALEASFGLGYTALLYSAAGPKLGLSIFGALKGEADLGTCEWNAAFSAGLKLEYGAELQIPVFDEKIWDSSGSAELASTTLKETKGPIPSCGSSDPACPFGSTCTALEFDGTGWAETCQLGQQTSGTFEAWIYPRWQTGAIMDADSCGVNFVGLHSTNGLESKVVECTGKAQSSVAAGKVPLDTWTHVARTWTPTTHALYINGELVKSDAKSDLAINKGFLMHLGHRHSNGQDNASSPYNYFKGYIDEVRLWNVPRTAAELQSTMKKRLAGSEAGLIGYWPIDTGTGTVVWPVRGCGGYLSKGVGWYVYPPGSNTGAPVVPCAPPAVIGQNDGAAPLSGGPATNGIWASDMVVCRHPTSALEQCSAPSLCAPGWHLCTASEFLARGGKTGPYVGGGWLASCVNDNGVVTAPTDSLCTCGAATLPAYNEVFEWNCDGTGGIGGPGGGGLTWRLGVRANNVTRKIASLSGECAYWHSVTTTTPSDKVLCCK